MNDALRKEMSEEAIAVKIASTDTVIRKEIAAKKEAGWCEANGIDHAWEVQDYVLTTDPPQSVRICTNCGKRQYLQHTHPDWHD